jgi:hypothetical protein
MQRIRAVVVSDAGWLNNVPLDEYGVYPEDRLAKGRPRSELEPLAQTGQLSKGDQPLYFGDGRENGTRLDALTTLGKMSVEAAERAERAEAGNKAVLECLLQVLAKAPVNCMRTWRPQLWTERAQQFLKDHTPGCRRQS